MNSDADMTGHKIEGVKLKERNEALCCVHIADLALIVANVKQAAGFSRSFQV